jgi:hypothetical protein
VRSGDDDDDSGAPAGETVESSAEEVAEPAPANPSADGGSEA